MKRPVLFGILMLALAARAAWAADASQATALIRKTAYRLSLEEATRIALENNFDIQLAAYDARIARAGEPVAESIYDTIFSASAGYRDNQRKQTSTILGSRTRDNDYDLGLSKKLPTGTTLDIAMENNRHASNSPFTSSPLSHDSVLGVTLTQDLAKNIFGLQDRGSVTAVLMEIESSQYSSLHKIEESLAAAQKAYWGLVLQNQEVAIQEAMTAQAKKLYDTHKEKLTDGLIEIPEAIASEANYMTRKNALMLERSEAEARASALKLQLNVDEDIEIVPTEPFVIPDGEIDLAGAMKEAFDNRQDYKKALNEIRSRAVVLKMKKNNMWPEINLEATLEKNGLGDHFKQAVTQITEQDNPDYFFGLTVSFPLENNSAKGQLKAAELERAKAIVELKLLERQIAVKIADSVRDCNLQRTLALNSREIERLQTQKLEEEKKRFGYGRSNTDTLIRFQEDLVRAQETAAQAVHRYHTALVDLKMAQGSLVRRYGQGPLDPGPLGGGQPVSHLENP